MRTIKLSLMVFGVLLYATSIFGQSNARSGQWCGTDQRSEQRKLDNPGLIQAEQNFRQQIRTYMDANPAVKGSANDKTSPYIIPLVFHCITDNGLGYISKADIEDAVLTLNEDFQRNNTDASNTRSPFAAQAMSMNIQFRLAHLDPSGNCTEGIVRADSPLSTNAGDAVKAVSRWDPKKYFNIWVVNSIDPGGSPGIILGYAYLPWSGIDNVYGVIVNNNYVGRIERTLTHEVGHSFGLLHTFDNNCGNNCSNSGDWMCDTPPSITATYGCSFVQNTCSNDGSGPDPYGNADNLDQIENYMSYDACQNMFSLDQQAAMEGTLNSTSVTTGLDQLNTAGNRAATGVADPYLPANCAPIADFDYDKKTICEGGSITYSDDSYNAIPNGWSWTFTGGTPNSSPLPNPTIIYNTAGVYSASYQPSSPGGTASIITKVNIITVNSLTADYIGPIIDGFENTTQYALDWEVVNHAGNGLTWENNNAAFTTGSRSVRIRNYFNSGIDKHDLISPSFDVSATTSKVMKFKQAYAKKAAGNNDKLLVFWSIDCGESWSLKLPLTSASMGTAPDMAGVFVPNSTQWAERTIDLTPIGSSTNVRFKFEFTEGGGNDIYLDDINIGDFTIGIDDFSNIGSFSVYPNPTSSSAQISFNLIKDVENLSIKIRNAVGQEVTSVINGQPFNAGKYTLKIDEQGKLSSGIYFVEFIADDSIKIEKLIVQ